jgi:hypothetical protein
MVVGTPHFPAYCNGWVVRGILAGITMLPLVPVTVIVEFPMKVEVLYAEVSVSVTLPEVDVVMEGAESLAVTPAGNPLTNNATVPLNPSSAEALMV